MASSQIQSFLRVDDLSETDIPRLFSRAKTIKDQLKKGQSLESLRTKQVTLIFSESSTRTKMSFQLAAQRLGAQCMIIDNVQASSMSKGETFLDTFWTLHSMAPDLFIIRCGDSEPLQEIAEKTKIPVINGGFGSKAHPTQALLDLFTMKEHFGSPEDEDLEDLKGLKVLFVGDVGHSRVVRSDIKLFRKFGIKPGIYSPWEIDKSFSREMALSKKGHQDKSGSSEKKLEKIDLSKKQNQQDLEEDKEDCSREIKEWENEIEIFDDLKKAVSWCDVYMGLRIQFERDSLLESLKRTLSMLSSDDRQKVSQGTEFLQKTLEHKIPLEFTSRDWQEALQEGGFLCKFLKETGRWESWEPLSTSYYALYGFQPSPSEQMLNWEPHMRKILRKIQNSYYILKYTLNQTILEKLSDKAIIMHPGPVNWGVEFDLLVRSDPRLCLWKQKENGVYIRASLMELLLKV